MPRRRMAALVLLSACGVTRSGTGDAGAACGPTDPGLDGVVTAAATGEPVAGARVTLLDANGEFLREVRTDGAGRYLVPDLPAGTYAAGASARDLEYVERSVTIFAGCEASDFVLGPEAHPGRWDTIGDPGEIFGGTNSGVLLPDGRILYCHDTLDPVLFDPESGGIERPRASPRRQGCHAVTLLADGRAVYVGGADQPFYGPGTRQVKTFDVSDGTWQVQPDLTAERWYPTMVPLPDGGLLAVGGGGLDNPVRVRTSEVMDPATLTWTAAGDIALGNEVSPVVLLFSGEVLMTHRPPQRFDPGTAQWRLAADFVQGDRMPNGDHADHEIQLLPDGRVVALGHKPFSDDYRSLVELYDPDDDRWTLGPDFAPARSRASTVTLPDGRILVLGGYKEDGADSTPTNEWGYMAIADLFDPGTGSWRRLSDMSLAREYHAMPVVVPDGRVIVLGGEGAPGNEPASSLIEALSPPYLFRGPRPEIRDLETRELQRGQTVSMRVERTAAPTAVVLMGTNATTHFMDSGNLRYLELPFEQQGDAILATVPDDPARAVPGWYFLLVRVDDIPSAGIIVRVRP